MTDFSSKYVKNGDVEIYTEAFGDANNPVVILIMGATAQSVMWPEEFCKELASKGLCVVRYDHRDTGKSSRIDYKVSPYTLADLSDDVVKIIEVYSPAKPVHLVGASMGSFIAQTICLKYPSLVATLACIMSSPKHTVFVDGFLGKDTSHHPLPPSNPKILEFYQEILSVSSKDVDEDKAIHQEIWNRVAGEVSSEHAVNTRIFEGKILKRLKNPRYVHNHSLALASSKDLYDDLKNLKHPTLVVHGADDYVLPIEHGRLLAQMLPNATFIEYEHMGHCLPKRYALRLLQDLEKHILSHSKSL